MAEEALSLVGIREFPPNTSPKNATGLVAHWSQMDMNVTDSQIGRQFRRIQLGFRFLAHGARTQTTCHWTGLTPDQLATLRRRWMFNADERLRGPSPSSFEAFFASRRRRSQAALFLGICRVLGAAPPGPVRWPLRTCRVSRMASGSAKHTRCIGSGRPMPSSISNRSSCYCWVPSMQNPSN